MDDSSLYLLLGAIVVIGLVLIKGGQPLLGLIVLAIGGWVYYNHDKGIDLTETIYETIDNNVKSDYEQKFKSDDYVQDTEKVK